MAASGILTDLYHDIGEEAFQRGVEEGGSYEYVFSPEWLPRLREMGWRLPSHVRRTHKDRVDLPDNDAVPGFWLPAPRMAMHDLTADEVGGVYEVDVTLTMGAQLTVERSHWFRMSDNAIIDTFAYDRGVHGDAMPVLESCRDVVFGEPSATGSSHDMVAMNGRIYGRNAMDWRMGDTYRVLAAFSFRGKPPSPYLEVLGIRPVDVAPKWTDALASRMSPSDTEPRDFMSRLARSIAPDTGDSHFPAKVSCLLSCVNSVPLNNQRPNIHTILVGPPASGKTQVALPLAEEIMHLGEFVDGAAATSVGLTFAEGQVAGQPAVSPGPLTRSRLVVIDEATSMDKDQLRDLNTVIESQVAVYTKRFKAKTKTDVSVILTCNPTDDTWNDSLTVFENLSKFHPSFISRFNIFKMDPTETTADDIKNVYDDALGVRRDGDTSFTRHEVAAYLAHARSLRPEVTPECREALTEWLAERSTSKAQEINSLYGKRTTVAVLRNACAFAKLLLRDTVDAECARLSIWLLEESIKSLNVTSLSQLHKPSSKSGLAVQVMEMLNSKYPMGWSRDELYRALANHPRHFSSYQAARQYILNNLDGCLWRQSGDVWLYKPE